MIRYEILLPLYYSDGRRIEPEKFLGTDEELVGAFGATSTDSVTVSGRWMYRSTLYEDRLVRVRVAPMAAIICLLGATARRGSGKLQLPSPAASYP